MISLTLIVASGEVNRVTGKGMVGDGKGLSKYE